MPIIIPANSAVGGGFDVANSVRYNDGDSPKLNINFASDGVLNKWTFSMWFKRSTLGTAQRLFCALDTGMDDYIKFGTDDQIEWGFDHEDSNRGVLKTNRVFRDTSAWYHIVCRLDTTDSTAGNRMRMYINGVEETSFATDTNPPQNETGDICRDNNHYIGTSGSSQYFDGYFAEVCMINNQSLDPTSFGEFDEDSGIWKPIDVSGLTPGTNGFYLDFEDSSNLGNDAFGGTDWTEVNLTAIDQSTDTCTNNFATLNPLNAYYDITTLSEGNLKYDGNSANGQYTFTPATMGFSKGKWYWEMKFGSSDSDNWGGIGITSSNSTGVTNYLGGSANAYAYYGRTLSGGLGVTYTNNTQTNQGLPFTNNDIIMVAVDCDNLAIYFGKNGTWLNNSSSVTGVPTSGSSKTGAFFSITAPSSTTDGFYFPANGNYSGPQVYVHNLNYGSPPYAISSGNSDGDGYGNFEYAVPSGYFSLNSKNLAEYG